MKAKISKRICSEDKKGGELSKVEAKKHQTKKKVPNMKNKNPYMDDTHCEHNTKSGPLVIEEFRVKTRNCKIHLRENIARSYQPHILMNRLDLKYCLCRNIEEIIGNLISGCFTLAPNVSKYSVMIR